MHSLPCCVDVSVALASLAFVLGAVPVVALGVPVCESVITIQLLL